MMKRPRMLGMIRGKFLSFDFDEIQMRDGKWLNKYVTKIFTVYIVVFTVCFNILSINSRKSQKSDCTRFHSGLIIVQLLLGKNILPQQPIISGTKAFFVLSRSQISSLSNEIKIPRIYPPVQVAFARNVLYIFVIYNWI